MKSLNFLLIMLASVLLIAGCNKDSTAPEEAKDPAEGLMMAGQGTVENTKVEIYTERTPEVGYNKIYVKMTDTASNTLVEDADITISTMMDMGHMQHSSPYENPQGHTAVDGLFPCAANFIMSGMWQLHLHVHNHDNNDEGDINLTIDVAPGSNVKNIVGTDSMTYFVTLVNPSAPEVGMNDFEITVHYRENMMSFPAVENITVAMEPSMPSMGHGSPNNVNPAHHHQGHYMGKVNFTMTGDWRIDLDFMRGDSLMHTSFDINVP